MKTRVNIMSTIIKLLIMCNKLLYLLNRWISKLIKYNNSKIHVISWRARKEVENGKLW